MTFECALLQMPAEKCELVEAIKEHRGKSEPLFLFFRVSSTQS